MLWAGLILPQFIRQGLKWTLRRAQEIFMPANRNYYYDYHFEGHWGNKNWKKMTTKLSEEYFLHQQCKKTATNSVMVSQFWLAACIKWWFHSHFSPGLFQWAKIYISLLLKFLDLAHKMSCNPWKSDNKNEMVAPGTHSLQWRNWSVHPHWGDELGQRGEFIISS